MRALNALLAHPYIARVESDVVAGGAGAEHDHAAALHDETRDREGRLARMLEHHVDVVALAGDVPDRLAEFARFLGPVVIFGRADLGHRAPAFEVLAVDDALGAERQHEVALAFVTDDADRIGARHGAELHGKGAETARRAPHQHVVTGTQDVRTMAEEQAVGGGTRQRVTGRLFPCQMPWALHELAVLHARELREGTVRRLVAPDAL